MLCYWAYQVSSEPLVRLDVDEEARVWQLDGDGHRVEGLEAEAGRNVQSPDERKVWRVWNNETKTFSQSRTTKSSLIF